MGEFMRLSSRLAMAALFCTAAWASPAQAEDKTFPKPKLGAYRLDWCLNYASQCGKPAARAWCKKKGFDDASDFEQAEDIGDVTPTRILNSGEVCDDESCDGFSYITCVAEEDDQGQEQTFKKPVYSGFRLDWCFAGQSGCGKKAANAYCDSQGYDIATNFQLAPKIGPFKPTRQIGSGAVCNRPLCDAFKFITCSK
jgi:hypothetical protein